MNNNKMGVSCSTYKKICSKI